MSKSHKYRSKKIAQRLWETWIIFNNVLFRFLKGLQELLLLLIGSTLMFLLSFGLSSIENDGWLIYIMIDGMFNIFHIVVIVGVAVTSRAYYIKRSQEDNLFDLLNWPQFRVWIYTLFVSICSYIFYFVVRVFGYEIYVSGTTTKVVIGMIPVSFVLILVSSFLMNKIASRIRPILFLREFGENTLATKFSRSISKEIRDGNSEVADPMLHELRKKFIFKSVFAYFDQKLDPGGRKENKFQYLEESDDWLQNVERCAHLASCIVLLPSNSESVLEEMHMIQENNLFYKTFIFMPYEIPLGYEIREDWNHLRKKLKADGFELPEYDRKGMIYKPGSKFEVTKYWHFYDGFQDIGNIPEFYKISFAPRPIYKMIHDTSQ